jgi:hypothetical protein
MGKEDMSDAGDINTLPAFQACARQYLISGLNDVFGAVQVAEWGWEMWR